MASFGTIFFVNQEVGVVEIVFKFSLGKLLNLQLSFFAHSPFRCSVSAISDC